MTKNQKKFTALLEEFDLKQLDDSLCTELRPLQAGLHGFSSLQNDPQTAVAETLTAWISGVLDQKDLEAATSSAFDVLQSVFSLRFKTNQRIGAN